MHELIHDFKNTLSPIPIDLFLVKWTLCLIIVFTEKISFTCSMINQIIQ
ncbi:hypothetical protein KP78_22290 [Jeotgalibacillus soli]|uniref:Uncharacterized protein n=1 Tax=Jeotgalibacillus soli TaxID=889306 RepID=A0A0C2R6K3_9BACL|nr:hypothetical protein KP78_22290 [Jeotgalibacillus soli]